MKKWIYLLWITAFMAGSVFAETTTTTTATTTTATTKVSTGTEPMKDACSITCYEKTPTCYVTQDKEGCLIISDKKPECHDGKCVCEIPGCEKKTVIKLKN